MNYTVDGNKVRFACAACNTKLTTRLVKAGQTDFCPSCGAQFISPGQIELKQRNQAKQDAKTRAAETKQKSPTEGPSFQPSFSGSPATKSPPRQYQAPILKSPKKIGFGFLLNPSSFLKSDIYDYENTSFPALAAAIRYYALASKVIWHIIRFIVGMGVVFSFWAGTASLLSLGSDRPVTSILGLIISLPVMALVVTFLIILNNLYLVLSLAILELARVLLKIEGNTRNS